MAKPHLIAALALLPLLHGCSGDESKSGVTGAKSASYVRFVDLTKDGVTAKFHGQLLSPGNLSVGVVAFGRSAPKPAKVEIEGPGSKSSLEGDFAADSATTIYAFDKGGHPQAVLISGEPRTGDASAPLVSVVNLTGSAVEIVKPSGLPPVDDGKASSPQKLEAGPLTLSAKVNGKSVKLAAPADLKAGEAYSLVFDLRSGVPEAFVIQNSTKMIVTGLGGSSAAQ